MVCIYSILEDSMKKDGTVLYKDKYVTCVTNKPAVVFTILKDLLKYKTSAFRVVEDILISKYINSDALCKYVLVIENNGILHAYHLVIKTFDDFNCNSNIADNHGNIPITSTPRRKQTFYFIKKALLDEIYL